MIASGVQQMVPVEDIELDKSNPRIRKFLEMYPEPTSEQIALALGAEGDDIEAKEAPTYEKLRNSILTNRGVIQPVIINRHPDGVLVCIDGNTRVTIYQKFARDDTEGNWDRIPALVHEGLDEAAIDAVRLQVHLVGPRPWDPYSKAKYLHHLRMYEHLSFGKIVDFCGGRQREIMILINAFEDMERYYRPIVPDDGSFDTRRFSGFVELHKMPKVKPAVAEAGHTLTDFARWVHERKLEPLQTVRQLPEILRTPKAKEVFLKKGAREAIIGTFSTASLGGPSASPQCSSPPFPAGPKKKRSTAPPTYGIARSPVRKATKSFTLRGVARQGNSIFICFTRTLANPGNEVWSSLSDRTKTSPSDTRCSR